MNSSYVIYFLNNLKNDIGSVSNVIYIERVIDLIKLNATLEKDNFESNCIIDWELYHKMKGGDYKIDTEYKFNQKQKNHCRMKTIC